MRQTSQGSHLINDVMRTMEYRGYMCKSGNATIMKVRYCQI